MTEEEFEILTDKLRGEAKYLYFHLMGEPTLHPLLPKFIRIAKDKGFIPMLTTNGSLLGEKGDALLANLPSKVSISLHAPDANETFADPAYLDNCLSFAKRAAEKDCIIALRLWNLGTDADNAPILERLHAEFPNEWVPVRGGSGQRLAHKLFLEWGEHFDWPDLSMPAIDENSPLFCYALRNHAAVLVDGNVVPCCLDADGIMTLGNLFHDDFATIIGCDRARNIYDGFTQRRGREELCRKCGFARRFK